MCDTLVFVGPEGPQWLAKNSDREPGEAQAVEYHPAADLPDNATVACTHRRIAQAGHTYAVWLCRPVWMWGAEMGINEHGVTIGNEAVFTRLPVERTGLTGMDLLRLALERSRSAADALELLIELCERYPQGGRMGYRQRNFRYHSAFLIADAREAWLLETAAHLWAARRIRGAHSSSNLLSIGGDFDRIHPDAYAVARRRGWCRRAADLSFARCFGDPLYRIAAGGAPRRTRTAACLAAAGGAPRFADFARALTDHGDRPPRAGLRSEVPCAHASWQPTRWSGQTTGSMIVRFGDGETGPRAWFTGTSSPCLSVFKPVALDRDALAALPATPEVADAASLWWRHERLHRACLRDYAARRATFASELETLRAKAAATSPADAPQLWEHHRRVVGDWLSRVETTRRPRRPRRRPFDWYWTLQSYLDRL